MSRPSPLPQKDRRVASLELHAVGTYSPGITRLEQAAMDEFRAHDEFWRNHPHHNNDEWMWWYSLTDHSLMVSHDMQGVSEVRGRNQKMVGLSRGAGRLHDTGKLDPRCEIYRWNGSFSDEVRLELRRVHPVYSDEWIVSHSPLTRCDDQPLVSDLRQIVLNHHTPWLVTSLTLREICVDLYLIDMLRGVQEKRHTHGPNGKRKVLTPSEALAFLERVVEKDKRLHEFRSLHRELDSSLQVIKEWYGLNLAEAPNPHKP